MAQTFDIAVTPWSVLGAGVLTDKYNRTQDVEGRVAQWGDIPERELAIAAEVVAVADEIGKMPSQVAISWVRQQPGVIIPIVGARRTDQVADNLGAADFDLTDEQLSRLTEASSFELGFPHDMLAAAEARDIVYGGTCDQIDRHR